MATIALSANRINQMPSMIKQVKQSVADYKTELFTLKKQILTINQSICNLNDVLSSIQASTQTQEDKIDSLDDLLRDSEEFIADVVRIDDKAAEVINRRRDEFYEAYYYLKPECEKNWIDKAKDVLISASEWCRENWQSIVKLTVTAVVIAVLGIVAFAASVSIGGTLAFILSGAFCGALSGALIGGLFAGITSYREGGSFLKGFADGALEGMITGALSGAAFAGVVVLGAAVGTFLGGCCHVSKYVPTVLKIFGAVSKVSGVLSIGMATFDTIAMAAWMFNSESVLFEWNQKLHSSNLYNGFQFLVTITAVFTGPAYASMRERMKFPPTCFVAGTIILTAAGLVAIENVKAGDKVIATNPHTFEQAEKTVVETYVHKTPQLIHLTIHGETITTTWNHPFYVKDKGFVNAAELQVGNQVVSADGEIHLVENHQVEIVETPETVYNFQVEDFHTYHVGNAGVLVHNANCNKDPVIDNKGGTSTIKSSDLVFESSTKSTQKLMNQMNSRGWTEGLIRNTVDNPYTIRTSVNKATGNSATVFYTQQGSYVIVDDVTKAIVQISDNINPSTWAPDLSIVDPYIPD